MEKTLKATLWFVSCVWISSTVLASQNPTIPLKDNQSPTAKKLIEYLQNKFGGFEVGNADRINQTGEELPMGEGERNLRAIPAVFAAAVDENSSLHMAKLTEELKDIVFGDRATAPNLSLHRDVMGKSKVNDLFDEKTKKDNWKRTRFGDYKAIEWRNRQNTEIRMAFEMKGAMTEVALNGKAEILSDENYTLFKQGFEHAVRRQQF